jgi:antitoxin component YwqK of YwqJK toxin-antitoxin module
MTRTIVVLIVILLLLSNHVFGQTNGEQLLKIAFPSLPAELHDNIIVSAGFLAVDGRELLLPCPPAYTNLLTNTNLVSTSELKRIKEAINKYKNVKTNCGPAGTEFKGWKTALWKFNKQFIETNLVACFSYTNSADVEEVSPHFGGFQYVAHFRTPSNDGYDVLLYQGKLMRYAEYKNGVLDGLDISPNDDARPNESYDKISKYQRFSNGLAIGKFIAWANDGSISGEWEYLKPFDVLKYSAGKWDLSWTEFENPK